MTSAHMSAMLSNMAVSLIKHEMVKTTLPKAKMLRPYFEKLVTKAKNSSLSSIRYLISKINDKSAVFKLIFDLAVRSKNRQGGYVRIVKGYSRYGDNAPMAYISFIDQAVNKNRSTTTKNIKPKKLALDESVSKTQIVSDKS